jgi:hypothetical protein
LSFRLAEFFVQADFVAEMYLAILARGEVVMGRKALDSRSVYFSGRGRPSEAPDPAVAVQAAQAPQSLRAVIGRLRGGDELVVQRLEDLGGDLVDILGAVERLHRRRVRLKVLQDDLDSASGRMADVLCGLRLAADVERRLRATTWKREIEDVRERGAFRAGRPRLLSVEEVAAMRADGLGATEIARRLKVSRWTVYRTLKRLEPA